MAANVTKDAAGWARFNDKRGTRKFTTRAHAVHAQQAKTTARGKRRGH